MNDVWSLMNYLRIVLYSKLIGKLEIFYLILNFFRLKIKKNVWLLALSNLFASCSFIDPIWLNFSSCLIFVTYCFLIDSNLLIFYSLYQKTRLKGRKRLFFPIFNLILISFLCTNSLYATVFILKLDWGQFSIKKTYLLKSFIDMIIIWQKKFEKTKR